VSIRKNNLLLGGFIASIVMSSATWACSPIPGAQPSTISQRVDEASYVFEGQVTASEGNVLTIEIDEYFKGEGTQEVKLDGLINHSCGGFYEVGDRAIFFATKGAETTLDAKFDGAFGATLPANEEFRQKIQVNQSQNLSLQNENCTAIYDGSQLYIPCVKIEGVDEIYRARFSTEFYGKILQFNLREIERFEKAGEDIDPDFGQPVDSEKPVTTDKTFAKVDEVEIISEASNHTLRVAGILTDGCQKLAPLPESLALTGNGDFVVSIMATSPAKDEETACTTAIEPFEVMIPLVTDELKLGEYKVTINENITETFMITDQSEPPPIKGDLAHINNVNVALINTPEQPPRAEATISGYLSDDCHALDNIPEIVKVNAEDDFVVTLKMKPVQTFAECYAQIQDFTITIPLDLQGVAGGEYNVVVNEQVTQPFFFNLPVDGGDGTGATDGDTPPIEDGIPVDTGSGIGDSDGEEPPFVDGIPVDSGDGTGDSGGELPPFVQDKLLMVESSEVVLLESFPLQAQVQIKGNYRNGCEEVDPTSLRAVNGNSEGIFAVNVYGLPLPKDTVCTDALRPFELSVPLNIENLTAGSYKVNVNDKITTSFELAIDNIVK